MSIKVIALACGYVESNQVGSLVFNLPEDHPGFETKVEALDNLGRYLFSVWKKENGIEDVVRCCNKKQGKNKFCPKCGKEVPPPDPFTLPDTMQIEEFRDWVSGLLGQTCDDLGYVFENESQWWPFNGVSSLVGTPKEEICVISQNGEYLMASVFGQEEDTWKCCYKAKATFADAVAYLAQ